MPKLYFRYGTMNSSKTANLLMVAHNYESQGKKVILIKPEIDSRYGTDIIKSRANLERKADRVINSRTDLIAHGTEWWDKNQNSDCILVDECQFLTVKQIEQLRDISTYTPVICYGLRTDYRSILFPASKRLMELADSIEEVKTTCVKCNRKAIINAKYINSDGKKSIVKSGSDKPDIGAEEKYQAMCWKCWDTGYWGHGYDDDSDYDK